jgi:RNA polymerase sigma-70 factor (ECF subfamily)
VTEFNVNHDGGTSATSSSLLQRVKCLDQQAWEKEKLVFLYSPVVYRWCRAAGLQEADSADVGQEVFVSVARGIGAFHHDRSGDTFRGWLHTIARNKLRDYFRKKASEAVGSPERSDIFEGVTAPVDCDSRETAEDIGMVFRRAAELIGAEFDERTARAFWRVAIDRQHPQDVAGDLGMTVNAVYLAKSRILRRLREEFEGLVDF